MSKYLVFVDTNILLDFYEAEGKSRLSLLRGFDKIRDRLITTYQVEMEFKKNRQRIIRKSLEKLKHLGKLQPVAFLAETRTVAALETSRKEDNKRIDRLRERLTRVLAEPTKYDPVYKVAQRLFTNDSTLNLTRENNARRQIKRAAFRRFILGYPPRKADDTSMGDALNWEWIVQVAEDTGNHIAIVSRDRDYGEVVGGKPYINDWLIQEFRDRVSKKRQCRLFDLLTPAFKLAGVRVSRKAEQEEKDELARAQPFVGGKLSTRTFSMSEMSNISRLLRGASPEFQLVEPLLPPQDPDEKEE